MGKHQAGPTMVGSSLLLLATFLICTSHAAYKPGWEPPSCLRATLRPSNVSIEPDTLYPGFINGNGQYEKSAVEVTRFHVWNETSQRMDPFFVRGVGYSPIWPSKDTFNNPFDLFTSEYTYVWRRDLQRMKDMGANTIRVWSWDSFRDHSAFLDACWEIGLYIMVPFFFDPVDYPIIGDAATRQQVLTDFRAFIMSTMSHPAVLAYLIGNELNTFYGSQRDELFSLVNQMIRIRDEVDFARHPISLPLADVAFVESYMAPYYQWSAMEFWSLQTYREPQFLHLPIQDYYFTYAVNMTKMGLPFKPLVMTEFGVDALPLVTTNGTWPADGSYPPQPQEDQARQAADLCLMYSSMRNNAMLTIPAHWEQNPDYSQVGMSHAGIVGGAIIMEWNDEWWKGSFPDVRAPNCPNQRPELHTWCAHDVGVPHYPYYLHEEWLGLASQIYDEDQQTFCLCPREAYYSMGNAFACNGDESCLSNTVTPQQDGFNCMPRNPLPPKCGVQWCAYRRNYFLNPYMSMLLPSGVIFLALVGTVLYLRRKKDRDLQSMKLERTMSRSSIMEDPDGNDNLPAGYREEEYVTSTRAVKLRDNIATAFLQYSDVGTVDEYNQQGTGEGFFCPYFRPAQERLFSQIWDKYLTFGQASDNHLVVAVRIIYEQLMENCFLFVGHPSFVRGQGHLATQDEMLSEMALYSIVQSWAGTINHCPEKICEVYEFAKMYFTHCVSNNHGGSRVNDIQDFHHGMVEIFRSYYLKVGEGEFTFEDVNTDAVLFRQILITDEGRNKLAQFWDPLKPEHDDEEEFPDLEKMTPMSCERAVGKRCPELSLLPRPTIAGDLKLHPYLEYHKQRNPENTLLSGCARCFFSYHEAICGRPWLKDEEAFPQKGGPFTIVFNYGYIIRYLLWQNLWATILQPITVSSPICFSTWTTYLAITDALWMFLSAWLHYRVLGRFTFRIVVELIFYGLAAGAIVAIAFFIQPVSKIDGAKASPSNAMGMGWTINTFYLIAAVLIVAVEELALLIRPSVPTYPIKARFIDKGVVLRTRIGFYLTAVAFMGAMGFLWLPGLTSSGSILSMINNSVEISFFPDFIVFLWWILFVVGACGLPYLVARAMGAASIDQARKKRSRKLGKSEADFLVMNFLYWGLFVAVNWVLAYYVLVPAINNITFDVCFCDKNNPSLTESEATSCKTTYTATCVVAVIFTWLSAELISFVALYAIFEMLLLVFGLVRGKWKRVGGIKTWQDVQRNFEGIQNRCTRRISSCMLHEGKPELIWNLFVEALYDDCLLSKEERNDYLTSPEKPVPNLGRKPRSEEAIRRIMYYMWSLESSMAHDEVSEHTVGRRFHRVRTMPTWTCVIPAYNETIIFEEEQLTRSRSEGAVHLRITEMEYLVHTFPDEWDNFAQRMKDEHGASWIINHDNYTMDLLQSFLGTPGHPVISEQLRFEVRWWATMRGQTLARTVAGMIHWRTAMLHLLLLEEPGMTMAEAQRIMCRKAQVVVSHQTYNPHNDIRVKPSCPHEEAIEMCFRRLKFFDLVYNDDENFQSVCKRVKLDILIAEADSKLEYTQTIQINVPNKKPIERKLFNYFPPESFDLVCVQRVGKLKIGEGKAENQMHALQFVNGMVLQAIDMNQYATLENGFKVPYILSDFFSTPDKPGTEDAWDGTTVIPQFRIVGFPEWAYTRRLSLVGELMGAAEWCFVTITHRVLDWPLRIRAHYGHPDFFDCFWVRNRGGQSKASPLVNTNEDIFAGYEMIGRGDRGAFIEFLEAQKGRETSFSGAFTFEAKLAQGGAQQCRSFDVYRLNRGLDFFTRYNLFFSSLAFYVTNLLMAISINYYILGIALYAISGVTYHKLGLLDAVIAIPWLVQIGYTLALPYLAELMIQRGFWNAIGTFIATLPPAVFFFIFHLRTKTYFFTQGLLIGKGGYAGTGRGFGLDRAGFMTMYKSYSESHYLEALLILAALIVYGVYGLDPPGAYMLRCWNIILIVASWLWAPILFNPAPTTQDLQNDLKEMLDWATNLHREVRSLDKMTNKLKRIHFLRLLGLIDNLSRECKVHLDTTVAVMESRSNRNVGGGGGGDGSPRNTGDHFDDTASSLPAPSEARFVKISHQLGIDGPHNSDADGVTKALSQAHSVFARSREKILRELDRIPEEGNKVDEMTTLDAVVKEYWGNAEMESWTGWYLRSVIMTSWESEDQFFPGLINLVFQKVYIYAELFLPWMVLAVDQYHVSSVWYLIMIIAVLGADIVVERGFHSHHEYTTLARGSLIILLPMAILYFHYGKMSIGELFWSLIVYSMGVSMLIRGVYGSINAVSKWRYFGFSGNPYHLAFTALTPDTAEPKERVQVSIKNRVAEMEATNTTEELRFLLFKERMQHLSYATLFRSFQPLLTTVFLFCGNVVTVLLSEWVTMLNFNGRVTEAWKKAYLRPSNSVSGGGGAASNANGTGAGAGKGPSGGGGGHHSGGGGGGGGADRGSRRGTQGPAPSGANSDAGTELSLPSEPLTRALQKQEDDVSSAHAAVHGSIAASLGPSHGAARRTMKTNRNLVASKLSFGPGGPPPAGVHTGLMGPQSSRTLMSYGSVGGSRRDPPQHLVDDESISERLLGGGDGERSRHGSSLGGQPKPPTFFLQSLAAKEMEKRERGH